VRTATEDDAGDAAGHRPPRDRRVPGEQAERAAIFRQHVGAELMDAALLSRTKDLLEEERAEAERGTRVLRRKKVVGRRAGSTAGLNDAPIPSISRHQHISL